MVGGLVGTLIDGETKSAKKISTAMKKSRVSVAPVVGEGFWKRTET